MTWGSGASLAASTSARARPRRSCAGSALTYLGLCVGSGSSVGGACAWGTRSYQSKTGQCCAASGAICGGWHDEGCAMSMAEPSCTSCGRRVSFDSNGWARTCQCATQEVLRVVMAERDELRGEVQSHRDRVDARAMELAKLRAEVERLRGHIHRISDPAIQSHHAQSCGLKLGHPICECTCGLMDAWVRADCCDECGAHGPEGLRCTMRVGHGGSHECGETVWVPGPWDEGAR